MSVMTARQHAVDSLAGRNHAESDAVILLAELARREGDIDRVRELLIGVGNARGQASALTASRLASILDVNQEIDDAYRQHVAEAAWLVDRPRRVRIGELSRRGWERT